MASSYIPLIRYLWLVSASLIAGVMNAMAGGDSFLSFPAMLGVGVPPVRANATNTVALWPGQLTSDLGGTRRIHRRALGEEESPTMLRGFVVATGLVIAAYFFWKQAQG